jgi:hypothetical protein
MTTFNENMSRARKATFSYLFGLGRVPTYAIILLVVSLAIAIYAAIDTFLDAINAMGFNPESVSYVGNSIVQLLAPVSNIEFYVLIGLGFIFTAVTAVIISKFISYGASELITIPVIFIAIAAFSTLVTSTAYGLSSGASMNSETGPTSSVTEDIKIDFAKKVLGDDVKVVNLNENATNDKEDKSDNIYVSNGTVYAFVKTWNEHNITLTLEKVK